MTKQPAIYILASRRNGTLYTGVTSDLLKRTWEHRSGLVEGFTKRYGVHRLVYFEIHDNMIEAIRREKQIKKWRRAWKIDLIESNGMTFGRRSWVMRKWIPACAGMTSREVAGMTCKDAAGMTQSLVGITGPGSLVGMTGPVAGRMGPVAGRMGSAMRWVGLLT